MQDANGHAGGKRLGGCTGRGFMPGQSGNPAGRPKGAGVTDRLRRLLEHDDGALAEVVAQEIVRAARRGDIRFIRLILDRIDGPLSRCTPPPEAVVYIKAIPQDDLEGAI